MHTDVVASYVITAENLKVKNCLEIRRKFSEILHTGALLEEKIEALFMHLQMLCYGAAQIRLRMHNYGSIHERVKAKQHRNGRSSGQD